MPHFSFETIGSYGLERQIEDLRASWVTRPYEDDVRTRNGFLIGVLIVHSRLSRRLRRVSPVDGFGRKQCWVTMRRFWSQPTPMESVLAETLAMGCDRATSSTGPPFGSFHATVGERGSSKLTSLMRSRSEWVGPRSSWNARIQPSAVRDLRRPLNMSNGAFR